MTTCYEVSVTSNNVSLSAHLPTVGGGDYRVRGAGKFTYFIIIFIQLSTDLH